jgi:hypothetical protein
LSAEATLQIAEAYELVIIHTSTPSFPSDALFAEKLKARKPSLLIGMVGAKVAVDPLNSLLASDAIDFVCREEFDFTCLEVSEGRPFARIKGLSYRLADGSIEHNEARPILEDMDALPFVAPVYKRDLKIDNYSFILGLPGETRETIKNTIRYAKEIEPHTIQVSLAARYPGTTIYKQAVDNSWLEENKVINLVSAEGVQLAAIGYPHLSREEIYHGLERFYKQFYFRPSKIWETVREMLMSWEMMKRRLREGVEFFRFLRTHEA